MSEKIKKNEKAKKQTWRAGNMLYPVPAVMVSCARKGEKPNIITVAWAGTVCSDPAMVSISVRKERYSHEIIKETGEFVINLTTRKLTRATDYCGVKSGRDVDKFADMHLTAAPSVKIEAPAIAESPAGADRRTDPFGFCGNRQRRQKQSAPALYGGHPIVRNGDCRER